MDHDKNKAPELRQVLASHLYSSLAFNKKTMCNSLTFWFSLCEMSIVGATWSLKSLL